MGIYHVTMRFSDDEVTEKRAVQATTFDEAWERISSFTGRHVIGGVVEDSSEPENYTIYGLGV